MDQSVLKTNLGKLVGQRNGFLLLSAFLSAATLLLSILLFSKHERVVIVPTSGGSYWVEETRVSDGYIDKMGLFLSDLLLNRSPADVERRNQIILQYVHPSSYHEIRKVLMQEQESILKGGQSFYFLPGKSRADAKLCAFITEGECFAAIQKEGRDLSITQKNHKTYTLRFSCENGKLMLLSLKKEES